MPLKPTFTQRWALKLIHERGGNAWAIVRANTVYSLRRRGWVTGCFEELALTDAGRRAIGVAT